MKARVFISYSNKDRAFADLILNYIENDLKIPCWIAYRDLIGGTIYSESINDAISQVECILLLFSENSNKSEHVKNELELAMNYNKLVIPCKLDNFAPEGQFNYYLKNKHWLELDKIPSIEQQKTIIRQSLVNVLGNAFQKKLHEMDALLTKIANEGANEHLQSFIDLLYDLTNNTYEGKHNRKLNNLRDLIFSELQILKHSQTPDFSNLIKLMNELWDVIRKTISD